MLKLLRLKPTRYRLVNPLFSLRILLPPRSTLFPYTTLFRSRGHLRRSSDVRRLSAEIFESIASASLCSPFPAKGVQSDRLIRSEEHRLNSSHMSISYAVFCLKKKILF